MPLLLQIAMMRQRHFMRRHFRCCAIQLRHYCDICCFSLRAFQRLLRFRIYAISFQALISKDYDTRYFHTAISPAAY